MMGPCIAYCTMGICRNMASPSNAYAYAWNDPMNSNRLCYIPQLDTHMAKYSETGKNDKEFSFWHKKLKQQPKSRQMCVIPFRRNVIADGFSNFRHVKSSWCIRYSGAVSICVWRFEILQITTCSHSCYTIHALAVCLFGCVYKYLLGVRSNMN